MKKLEFKARTLDDNLIREGLCAVSALESSNNSKNMSFVVGGVATQSYLPTSCRRTTVDIDLAVLRPFTYSQFQEFAKPALDYLGDAGYSVAPKKGHSSYQIIFNDSHGEAAIIEFARRNPQNYEKYAPRLEREFANTRLKVIEERKETCRFSSPEDIAVPKLVRSVNSLIRNPEFSGYLNEQISFPLREQDMKKRLDRLGELRQEAINHIGDLSLSERLRYLSDIYDMQVLSEIAGFNPVYLKEAISTWSALQNDSNEKRLLLRTVFPRLGLDKDNL